jgi:hypothetical protein
VLIVNMFDKQQQFVFKVMFKKQSALPADELLKCHSTEIISFCFLGEYPRTLLDPSLGNRLGTLRSALASILLVTVDSIVVLAIRPVYQYRSPYYPPLPFAQAKQQALTDVVFYVASLQKSSIETTINNNLGQFAALYGITANASGPNPCNNYVCPTGKNEIFCFYPIKFY